LHRGIDHEKPLVSLAAMMLSASSALATGPINTAVGTVWADSKGMTLYTLNQDQPDTSTCYGRCARIWPPMWAPADAIDTGAWSVIEREDGSTMWAYRGQPLYRYVKDEEPGSLAGEGISDSWGVWHAARAY
jgi:predicted lipoprotein with Yx(FWY)xxD motif